MSDKKKNRTGNLLSVDGQSVAPRVRAVPSQINALRRKQGEVIGEALRKQFQTILIEPVPDDLIALLDELERREIGS